MLYDELDQETGLATLRPIEAACTAAIPLIDSIGTLYQLLQPGVIACDQTPLAVRTWISRLEVDLNRLDGRLGDHDVWEAL